MSMVWVTLKHLSANGNIAGAANETVDFECLYANPKAQNSVGNFDSTL